MIKLQINSNTQNTSELRHKLNPILEKYYILNN